MRKAKIEFERSIVSKSKDNPKVFWSHIRSKLSTKTGIAPLLEDEKDPSSTRYDNKEKARILQKQFVSVFTREPDRQIPHFSTRTKN